MWLPARSRWVLFLSILILTFLSIPSHCHSFWFCPLVLVLILFSSMSYPPSIFLSLIFQVSSTRHLEFFQVFTCLLLLSIKLLWHGRPVGAPSSAFSERHIYMVLPVGRDEEFPKCSSITTRASNGVCMRAVPPVWQPRTWCVVVNVSLSFTLGFSRSQFLPPF